MKQKRRSGKEKLRIVLEGLKEKRTLASICNEHEITQGQYYAWRDKLIGEGAKAFEYGGAGKEEERLRNENQKLKGVIGELTVELKKKEEEWR